MTAAEHDPRRPARDALVDAIGHTLDGDAEILDLAAIRADDLLIDDLLANSEPPTADQIAAHLAAWRDEVLRDLPEP